MDVTIVYESIWGNTREVAEAIAQGVQDADPAAEVALVRAADATPGQADADLVIVGGPTHALRMSTRASRRAGLDSMRKPTKDGRPHRPTERGVDGPGVREWLDALPTSPAARHAAAFDTRLPYPLSGGAARSIARGLRRHGYRLAAKPCGFTVDHSEGPLRAGERERARAWGAGLVRRVAR